MPIRVLAALLAVLLLAGPAAAQTTFPIIGPAGMVTFSTASVTCVNTTTACTLFTYQVPPGLYATSPNTNVTPPVLTPPPLHLTMRGTITTNSGGQIGTINAGANFGGTTATIALLNAHTPAPAGTGPLTSVPIQMEVWVVPIATAVSANTVTVSGRVAYVAASASETVVNSFVIGTTTLNVVDTLAVNWLWSSASNTNSVTFYNETLQIGN